jgi:hypothetical protein
MKQFIRWYLPLLNPSSGVLIIEDIQSTDWIPQLTQEIPQHLKALVTTYDMRLLRPGVPDNMLFVVELQNP